MTKNEVLEMASECRLTYLDGSSRAEFGEYIDEQLQDFANAILERAAVECNSYTDKEAIRALKITTGEGDE